jgi:hypothetical protein
MTKQEAIDAMMAGAKVSHRFFLSNEWITMEGTKTIIDEEGKAFSTIEFWKHRTTSEWQINWEIWNSKK